MSYSFVDVWKHLVRNQNTWHRMQTWKKYLFLVLISHLKSLKKEIPSWTTRWCNSLPVLSPKQSMENVAIPKKTYGRIARHISKAFFMTTCLFHVCLQSSCVVLVMWVLNLSILQERSSSESWQTARNDKETSYHHQIAHVQRCKNYKSSMRIVTGHLGKIRW